MNAERVNAELKSYCLQFIVHRSAFIILLMTVRVRFAPSPTGYLHIGAARSALFNWLYAQKTGGKFLLRIEDTDLQRSTDESTRSIIEGLRMARFGLRRRDCFSVRQRRQASRRRLQTRRRRQSLSRLHAQSRARRCNCQARHRRPRARPLGSKAWILRSNPFRDLSPEESDQRAAAGEPFAVRLKIAREGKTHFEDIVYGPQERDYTEIEDLVLLRSDGHPLYNLSVVIDDIEMGITHVIRGQDHLTNTHKQMLLYEALGAAVPQFAHLPLILAPNKGKLSKRKHGEVVSLTTYRDRGFVPAAFRNFLALLGWAPSDGKEMLSVDELVEKFSLEHIHRSPAVFNFQENDPRHWTDEKALWMNAEYIRTMPVEELLPMVKAELRANKLWREEYDDDDREWFVKAVDLIRQRFFTLKDFSDRAALIFPMISISTTRPSTRTCKKDAAAERTFAGPCRRLGEIDPFTAETAEAALRQFAEEAGVKAGLLINGSRTMLTGQAVGPSMFEVFDILGQKRSVERLRSGVPWFDAMSWERGHAARNSQPV